MDSSSDSIDFEAMIIPIASNDDFDFEIPNYLTQVPDTSIDQYICFITFDDVRLYYPRLLAVKEDLFNTIIKLEEKTKTEKIIEIPTRCKSKPFAYCLNIMSDPFGFVTTYSNRESYIKQLFQTQFFLEVLKCCETYDLKVVSNALDIVISTCHGLVNRKYAREDLMCYFDSLGMKLSIQKIALFFIETKIKKLHLDQENSFASFSKETLMLLLVTLARKFYNK